MLADKIITLRKQQGWSQEELADRMGVTRQSVSKWESAQSTPDLDKLVLLSQLFGVTTDHLLKDEPAPEANPAATPSPPPATAAPRWMSAEEAAAYLQQRRQAAIPIALGVLLCVLSPICLLVLMGARESGALPLTEDSAALIGLVALFILVVPAVLLFVFTGIRSMEFEYLDKVLIAVNPGVEEMVRRCRLEYRPAYIRGMVLGVGLCVVSPVSTLIGAFSQNPLLLMCLLSMTLVLAGLGVAAIVAVNIRWESMQKLLQEADYTPTKKKAGALLETFSSVYWLLATAVYLGWSFATNSWATSWILWPVAGVLYAVVAAVCEAVIGKKE